MPSKNYSTIPTPAELYFKGRPGDARLGEYVQTLTAIKAQKSFDQSDLIIHGCPDDLGITRNRGRAGAALGPNGIRSAFYKIALPFDSKFEKKVRVHDAGNISVSKNILETHKESFETSRLSAALGATVIALGGGHDFAAPNILGWLEGRSTQQNSAKRQFGVINIDPHLDVRELEEGLPHSGTPFRQILDSKKVLGPNLVQFGAREGRNARSHFEYCSKQKVQVLTFDSLKNSANLIKKFEAVLKSLSAKTTDIALTIDIDSCHELEGASAAPVIGFTAWELCQFAKIAGASKKVSYLEIAEVAPNLDTANRSARIGAEILFYFLLGRSLRK